MSQIVQILASAEGLGRACYNRAAQRPGRSWPNPGAQENESK